MTPSRPIRLAVLAAAIANLVSTASAQDFPTVSGTHPVLVSVDDLPIVLQTGLGHSVAAEIARAVGIREWVIKPGSPQQLAAALARATASVTGRD